jgi:hypothetical protein
LAQEISNDCLHTLEIIGKILLFTPIIVSVIPILFAMLTRNNIGIDAGAYSAVLMTSAGFFILVYVSIQYLKRPEI